MIFPRSLLWPSIIGIAALGIFAKVILGSAADPTRKVEGNSLTAPVSSTSFSGERHVPPPTLTRNVRNVEGPAPKGGM